MKSKGASGGAGSSGGYGGGANKTRVGRYVLGRTLGEGTFAKVKFARNVDTGDHVAIKILDKDKVLKHKMINQLTFVAEYGRCEMMKQTNG